MAESTLLARLSALARGRPLEVAFALLVTAALGVWLYAGTRSAMSDLAAAYLRSLVASQAATVQTWVTEKRVNVRRWAADPRVLEAAERLLAIAAQGPAAATAACRGEPGRRLVAQIDSLRQEERAAAVALIGRDGRVLAARDALLCGHVIDAARRAHFASAFAGETRFAGSADEVERIGAAAAPARAEAKVWVAAPVRDATGTVIAVLDIGKPAHERFSRLFEAARLGATGEVYAFDARGRLLSESRFRGELEDMGLVRRGESTILRVELNDPESADEPRRTRLVAEALAARSRTDVRHAGELLQPYMDYVGRPVVGAWRWLDDMNLGIAVEVAESEAFAPLLRLERVLALLGTGVGIAVFGLVVALLRIRRMEIETEEARRAGNYELIEEVGRGGMARVYRARHRLLKRPTAVKIIELAVADDEALARFDREVRLASQLMHPNTIEIYDYGRTPEGQPFYAMEFLDGLTLQQIVETHGPIDAARAAHVLRGIAGSLSEAHEIGLVHRDIKPANVMLCRRGGEHDVVKVLDFGLVKDTRTEATRDLTRALRVLGTPAYMAPERIERPEEAGHRSDLYSLGAVGFFLLTGRPPYAAESELALAYQVVHTPAPRAGSLAPAAVPAALDALIGRCLEKSPERRPPSAIAVIDALDALLEQAPWSNVAARRWWDAHHHAPAASP